MYSFAIVRCVKLQKQLSRHFAGREYSKWVVVLPPGTVKTLGWKEGEELTAEVEGKSLRLRPASVARRPKRNGNPEERHSKPNH